ncbi:30S ribosomal chloroplastic [Brachionus plicatilis]|uniref:30S ribosomal chloroplastic n=1 Tax=Brachionus plicatilis TaxID=10195 RepID=A0A3M7PA56_BRAPC|nr:30S ribosomal chloroplastic [Brachionus plicatilis]
MASFLCKNLPNLIKLSPSFKNSNLLNRSCINVTCKTYTTEKPAEPEKTTELAPIEAESSKKVDKKSMIEMHPFGIAKANPMANNLGWQPTSSTHSALMIDGVPYNKIHVVSIKASKNNTIFSLSDFNGTIIFTTSAGSVGFKNSKKSTAVAGQSAGLALTENAKRRGIKNVRVVVKGLGNGRLASIKALQMGKLNIVSITDNTPIPLPFARTPRPPAKRKV